MFFLTPRMAKQLRSMLRATLLDQDIKGQWPILRFHADPQGTIVQAQKGDVALRWRLPFRDKAEDLAFRATLLAELEGTGNSPIKLGASDDSHGIATWDSGESSRSTEFETVTPESLPPFPNEPKKYHLAEPEFGVVLREAYRTTAKPETRLSLSRIQLRGSKNEVVATDGRQLLLHRGYSLPWSGDLLIPPVKLFGRKAWPEEDLYVGKSDSHVFLRSGAWDVALRIDTDSRYPDVSKVLPVQGSAKARIQLHEEDVRFLLDALAQKKSSTAPSPITLGFQSPPAVRFQEEGSDRTTEIELSRSTFEGRSLNVCQDRALLLRSLELGFREVRVSDPQKPLWSEDGSRLFLWMPLDSGHVDDNGQSTRRMLTSTQPANELKPKLERRTQRMPPRTNNEAEQSRDDPTLDDLIEQAEGLRQLHQEASSRMSRFISALKAQRKQTRVLRQAVASIRHLDLGG